MYKQHSIQQDCSPQTQIITNSPPPTQLPTVVIDLRRNRIRIHKMTLHLLGDPEFVQLLVNPQTQTIAIRCSLASDYRSQRIKWKTIAGKQCCELYSKYLLESLHDAFIYLEKGQVYRVIGQIYEKEQLAHFDLKNSIKIDTTGGKTNYE